MRHRQVSKREDGFTLIELLVVVVIIGILIAIAIPVYLNYRKGANDKAALSDLRNAINILESCKVDNSGYPTAIDGAGVMTGCDTQTLKLSANTAVRYAPSAPNYVLFSYNSGGTTVYCYSSERAGAVKKAAGTVLASATCP